MAEAFPLIELSGPPTERGLLYGRLAGERIARGAKHYHAQLERLGFDANGVAALVERLVPGIEAFDPSYVVEMRAIARGAQVPFATVALLNARTEILKLAKHESDRRGARPDTDPDGCTTAVVLPEASSTGRLIHAQNWDWKVECAETGVVLHILREDGPDILTFTEAGGLARSGCNAAGIAVTANYLESDRDYRTLGVPLALIRRKALESAHLAHALRTVATTPKSASNNIVVSHAAGLVFNFECAPDEAFTVAPENGLLVHANHWLSPVALAKLRDTGLAAMPDSLYRDLRVRQLLGLKGRHVSPDDVKEALFDDLLTPWSVCRPPRESFTDNLTATVAMLVIDPADGTMEIAPLPALQRTFTTYRLQRAAARSAA